MYANLTNAFTLDKMKGLQNYALMLEMYIMQIIQKLKEINLINIIEKAQIFVIIKIKIKKEFRNEEDSINSFSFNVWNCYEGRCHRSAWEF